MKRIVAALLLMLCSAFALAETYQSLEALNRLNLARYFQDYIGYYYDSHGCLHFSPSDIYLLAKTVQKGTPLTIKHYGDTDVPFDTKQLPYFSELTRSPDDLKRHAEKLKDPAANLLVYPTPGRLYLMIGDEPYAQVKLQPGPPYEFLAVYDVQKDGTTVSDFWTSTPTDAGRYSIFGAREKYVSNAYYATTVVPFGALIQKKDGKWIYQDDGHWRSLPDHIAEDLSLPYSQWKFNYYDVTLDQQGRASSARWGSHDFGKYVLLWTKDGKSYYPEMGYAEGELLYEQVLLVKDLAYILTVDGPDDLNACIRDDHNFKIYRDIDNFIDSEGALLPASLDPTALTYYKLFNGWELTPLEKKELHPELIYSMDSVRYRHFPFSPRAQQKIWGFYHFLRQNSLVMDKQANWHRQLKEDWSLWADLREKFRKDFEKMRVFAQPNRQLIVEQWLNDRLEFKLAEPPQQVVQYQASSIAEFFKTEEEDQAFLFREAEIMRAKLKKAISGEAAGLGLRSVEALNAYNFGLLLDEMLGNLYKSHGCLHVSPRNSQLLYDLLPIGTRMTIYNYEKQLDEKQLAKIPYLTEMVNFEDDLATLKSSLESKSQVAITVYPQQGYWIIYRNKVPFAKLLVLGGPKTKFYLLEGRDEKGRPIFEKTLAYPTTPGTFYIFKKVEDYLSRLYADTTAIPMGGLIKNEKGKWLYEASNGKWRSLPKTIEADITQPSGSRAYSYYDLKKDKDHKLIEARWGSHPFGKYALTISRDMIYPSPELIHSSGDLIMEQRQLVRDLIEVLSVPKDTIEECVAEERNFALYKTCFDFINHPSAEANLGLRETANYRLYLGLPLSTQEVAVLPKDILIADKILKQKGKLTKPEKKILMDEGIMDRNGYINMEKVLGLSFDNYQYVVAVSKYAHHYETLKKHWNDLSNLRQALFSDLKTFVIQDPEIFYQFTRALMMERIDLRRLSEPGALKVLDELL